MNTSEPRPSLPTWLFVVTDLALIGAAAVIGYRSAHPLSSAAMLAIFGCVALGAFVAFVPIVARYERQKNEALDDRQRALEALARTVSSSAEQISIATGSLNDIAELAQKNLRHAEHLPHKLQEKIAEFQAQLAAADDADKEEMEKELISLRTSESERLEAISNRIAKMAAEWTKLESAAAHHLAAATEAATKLPASSASGIATAQASAVQALGEARVATAKAIAEAEGNATRAIAAAQAASVSALAARIAEFEARLASSTTAADRAAGDVRTAVAAATRTLDEKINRLENLVPKFTSGATAAPPTPLPENSAVAAEVFAAPAFAASDESPSVDAATAGVAPVAEAAPAAPKRPRRVRRDETKAPPAEPVPSAGPPAEAAVAAITPAEQAVSLAATPFESPAELPPFVEPPPVLREKIVEVTPVVASTAEPFPAKLESDAAQGETGVPMAATESPSGESAKPGSPPKKRAARKTVPVPEPALDLPLEDAPQSAPTSPVERTLTSDGATRLLATAYIGIGNRLFIRGEGPGLSWEKGVPLQFVSIGKWRWETNDAGAPVRFKLYKNDELECTALGEQTLEPGRLQEVTAAF